MSSVSRAVTVNLKIMFTLGEILNFQLLEKSLFFQPFVLKSLVKLMIIYTKFQTLVAPNQDEVTLNFRETTTKA